MSPPPWKQRNPALSSCCPLTAKTAQPHTVPRTLSRCLDVDHSHCRVAMAFSSGHGDRVDNSRFLPSRDETFPSFTSALRAGIAGQLQAHNPPSSDARAALTRRFTTNTVPTLPTLSTLSALSPIGQARRQAAANPSDFTSAVRSLLSA